MAARVHEMGREAARAMMLAAGSRIAELRQTGSLADPHTHEPHTHSGSTLRFHKENTLFAEAALKVAAYAIKV